MTKAEFIDKMQSKLTTVDETGKEIKPSKKDCGKYVDSMLEAIEETVAAGDEIRFVGFGTFSRKDTAARTARNPKTGEEISVEASHGVKFKVGSIFKNMVKGE